MKTVFKIALTAFLLNAFSCLLFSLGMAGIAMFAISLLAQLVLGIIYAVNQEKKSIGQGMLIGLGIFLVVGFSVCTILVMNIHA